MSGKKEVYKEDMYRKLMPTQALEAQEGGSFYYDDDVIVSTSSIPQSHIAINTIESEARFINLYEMLVSEKLDVAIAKFSACNCDRCRMDITAIALNLLSPRYIVLSAGDELPPITKQEHGNISAAIIKAIVTVKANPRH